MGYRNEWQDGAADVTEEELGVAPERPPAGGPRILPYNPWAPPPPVMVPPRVEARPAPPAPSGAGGWWKQGDTPSPMQLAQWLAELKRRGLSDAQLAEIVTGWRAGRLPWGEVPPPLAPLVRLTPGGPSSPAGVGFKLGGTGLAVLAIAAVVIVSRFGRGSPAGE